jgi:uncharacterized protein YaeQ
MSSYERSGRWAVIREVLEFLSMTTKHSFLLEASSRRHRDLPRKLVLVHEPPDENPTDVLLKLLAFLLFFRDRLEIGANLHNDSIPYVPDLVQLDYTLRPVLWIECGACRIEKLDRLAVKVPEAELWIVHPSRDSAQALHQQMARHELRRDRYSLLAFDQEMIEELASRMEPRNRVYWVASGFDPAQMQFDFNGLWFDTAFSVQRF